MDEERKTSLAIISKLGDVSNRKAKSKGDDVLNVRKAIRSASKGQGAAALGRQQDKSSKRGKSRR